MAGQVDTRQLGELLHEYIEREEAAMLAGGAESIYSARYPRPPFFEHLTSLTISDPWDDGQLPDDPRVLSYVLAHARRLKELRLVQMAVNMDEAFTRRLIGAPLEKLDISLTENTDATIDVLCQQLATSLRSLELLGCRSLTLQGLLIIATTTTTTFDL